MAAYDLTALSTALEFDTTLGQHNSILRWSATRVVSVWNGSSDGKGLVQAFDVNAGTGAVTAIGSPLSLDGSTRDMNGASIVAFDSTHFCVVWRDGVDVNVAARMFAIDGSGVVTAAGAAFLMSDITNQPSAVLMDATHILVVGSGAGLDGYAKILAVNTGTWAITEPAAALEFDTVNFAGYNGGRMVQKVDSTHVLVAWSESEMKAQCLAVNTGTWAVTTVGSPLLLTGSGGQYVGLTPIDGSNHFLLTFRDDGSTGDGTAEVLEVNLSTYAVTEVGSLVRFDSGSVDYIGTTQIDSTTFGVMWGESSNGYAAILKVDASWNVTKPGATLNFVSGGTGFDYNSLAWIDDVRMVGAWAGAGSDGFIQAFDYTEPDLSGNAMFMGANF